MKAVSFAVTLVFLAVAQPQSGWAGEKAPAGDKAAAPKAAVKPAKAEVTLKGEMMCGKCSLKETEDCQNVLKVAQAGKEAKYYLADNKVAQDNHEQVCTGTAKATVVGKVKKTKGKNVLTASSIVYEE